MQSSRFLSVFLLMLLLLLIPGINTAAPREPEKDTIARLVENGGVLAFQGDKEIYSLAPDTPRVPASTIKLATTLAALRILGPDYRFTTAVFQDRDGRLIIKGSGDPGLVSTEVARLAEIVRQKGVQRVSGIVFDNTAFALDGQADGQEGSSNPYDAGNAALAVNFNTMNILVSGKSTTSAEPETPTLPIMTRLAKGLPNGTQRINISQNETDIIQYAGELLQAFLTREGIIVTGPISSGRVPEDLKPLFVHTSSKDLREVVRGLLEYSSNFTANQLFLVCGAKQLGGPATWEKGRKVLQQFLEKEAGLTYRDVIIAEGSGLSRKNIATPRALVKILKAFEPFAELLPEYHGALVKSGTLRGVSCYAGFFRRDTGLDPFVILLNQNSNNRDRILASLAELSKSASPR